MDNHTDILELTRRRFPHFGEAPMEVELLEKGGSDRKFFRLRVSGQEPIIFVQYGQQREENRHYVEIGAFLEKAGIRVPKMFVHELEAGRIWMEDLGERDLWSYRNEPWAVRKALYEETLRESFQLHNSANKMEAAEVESIGFQPAFDERLYRWEQDYFLQNCLGRHFGLEADVIDTLRQQLAPLAARLAELPRVLVHRDFQSQNIIISDGSPCLIDFQGMRFGLPQYDLASLLLDPYVELSAVERDELLEFYCDLWTAQGESPGPEFLKVYALCAAQRLMQALGAYGFLGHEKGRLEFLSHIPVALPRLHGVLAEIPELELLTQNLSLLMEQSRESLL